MQNSEKRRNRRLRGRQRKESARLSDLYYKQCVKESEPLFARVRGFKKSLREIRRAFRKAGKAFSRLKNQMKKEFGSA